MFDGRKSLQEQIEMFAIVDLGSSNSSAVMFD
jgi:hypothetical protein